MSVQLIIQPQNYHGFSNSNNTANQFLIDGIDFNNVNTSVNTIAANPLPQVAINLYNPTMSVNTWYRYYDILSTQVVKVGAYLSISSSASAKNNGIIQKLSNLTIGSVYNIEFNTHLITGQASILIYSGTILQSTNALSVAGIQTIQFTANSTEDTIVIASRYTTTANLLQLNSISVTAAPSEVIQFYGDGQVILDLYEDENLPLTFSVDDFKNVAENVQSYSKAFKLPATKRNSQIFDNIFEITRSVESRGGLQFNPYKRSKCILKQDGLLLFQGFLRLLEISEKNGEVSYNVNLYAEVIALADTLRDRTFRDLDFSELAHTYNYSSIRDSWQGILPVAPLPVGSFAGAAGATVTNVLKYPFIDWNHQYTYTNGGMPKLLTLETAFRPCIRIKYLIDRIFEASPFTFTSDFFNTSEFSKLYMDFNWGSDDGPVTFNDNGAGDIGTDQIGTGTFATIITDAGSGGGGGNTFGSNLGYSSGVYTAIAENQTYSINYKYIYEVTGSGNWEIETEWEVVRASGLVELPINNTITSGSGISGTLPMIAGNFTTILDIGDTLRPKFKVSTTGTNVSTLLAISGWGLGQTLATTSSTATTSDTMLQRLRGDLKQWDFLKGLLTMFNLVTLPDEDNPNNIRIEPYTNIFINNPNSKQLDWTEKVDTSEIKLTPLTDLNKSTFFKFVEDEDDYAFNKYKNSVGGHLYGSQKYNAGNEFNILSGENEITADPFAATLIKPLDDDYPDFITPAIYAMSDDDVSEGFDNSPRILYDNGVVDMTSTTYSVPAQSGSAANAFESEFLQFSHLSDIPTVTSTPPSSTDTKDFNFGACQLMTGVGSPTVNNLFNLYWLPYYSELYNPNTRTMAIKVNLSPADINTFNFFDTILIKNRVFRVNKIDYKPNNLAKVEFILIP